MDRRRHRLNNEKMSCTPSITRLLLIFLSTMLIGQAEAKLFASSDLANLVSRGNAKPPTIVGKNRNKRWRVPVVRGGAAASPSKSLPVAKESLHTQQNHNIHDSKHATLHHQGSPTTAVTSSEGSLQPHQHAQQPAEISSAMHTNNVTPTSSAAGPIPNTSMPRSASELQVSDDTSGTKGAIPNTSVPPSAAELQVSVDTTNPKEDARVMLLIRILFLVYYGSLGSIMPYLPVYYHSLGHGGQIIGMLGAVKPFTTFLVAPLWGAVSDQTHNPFFVLQLTFLVSLVGQLLVGARHEPWYITTMVFLTAVFNAPVKSLLDTMVLDHLHDRTSYGRLRLWGQMGFGLGSSAVGYFLSKSKHVSWADTPSFSPSFQESLSRYPATLQAAIKYANKCWQSITGYKLLFMAYAALSLPTWICIKAFRRLDGEAKEKEEAGKNASKKLEKAEAKSTTVGSGEDDVDSNVWHDLSLVFHDPDALLFFFLVLVVGISSGVIENFAYVRIREVGGTGKEMGISRLVSSIAGAPMFWFSGPMTKILGVDRVLVLSLLSYVIRFVIYAMMSNPYHGLPAEAMRGITFAAFWSSCTIYAHKVSPPGLHATMLMILNAMYGGLGQSLGAIWGGKLQHKFGTVKTFYYSGVANMIFVVGVIAYLGVRKDSSFRNPRPIEDTRPKKKKQETIAS